MQDHRGVGQITASTASFVGRQYEVEVLSRHFAAAICGQTQVVLVAGEPGIGKTRLLEHAAEQVAERGATVLRGGASEAEGMPPYLPLLEALGRYIRSVELDLLREQVGTDAATLASIFPELPGRLGELPTGYPLPVEQARLRLFEAVADFLATIAARAPLVLVLDEG